MRLRLIWCVLFFVSSASDEIVAQEWTRFRGPNGSGISDATTIPVEWTEKDFAWKQKLPGRGLSSPVVWGERVWLTSADEESGERWLICLSTKDGKILWSRSVEFSSYKKHKNNSYAASTPTCDEKRVYVLWQAPKASPLIAYDHAGKKIWEYDLGRYRHGQGGATSPIVYDDLVVIANDHKQGSSLLALGREDGKLRWSIPRKGKRACYTTPCIYTREDFGEQIVFSHCFEGITGVDPKSGEEKWMIDVFGTFSQRALGSPIVAGDLVIGSSGARAGERRVVAVRPISTGGKFSVEEVYTVTKSSPHVPTPIVYEDKLYLWNDLGIVSCLDVKTGKTVWAGRVRGNFFGSPICIGGKLYCVSARGDVAVLSTGDSFELLARNSLGERSLSTPAVSGGKLFVRTDSTLVCVTKSSSASSR